MAGKFTRRFDAQAPRNPHAELYDTHVPPPNSWRTAYTVPGARPRSAFHLSRECEALWRTLELVESLGLKSSLVAIELERALQTLTACPMCARRYKSNFTYLLCHVRLGAHWHSAAVLQNGAKGGTAAGTASQSSVARTEAGRTR